MARPRDPDKLVPVIVRLAPAEVEALDRGRGAVSRSAHLRSLVRASLAIGRPDPLRLAAAVADLAKVHPPDTGSPRSSLARRDVTPIPKRPSR
jgi:hypothetical protein